MKKKCNSVYRTKIFSKLPTFFRVVFTQTTQKCKFYQKEVKFLGKIIDKNGQRVNPNNVAAIVNMPAPKDKQTLRKFSWTYVIYR